MHFISYCSLSLSLSLSPSLSLSLTIYLYLAQYTCAHDTHINKYILGYAHVFQIVLGSLAPLYIPLNDIYHYSNDSNIRGGGVGTFSKNQ